MEYTFHRLADEYPLMGESDLDALAASIREVGQQEPIWLLGAQILDGRCRYLACKKIGVKPVTKDYPGKAKDEASLRAFVEAKNEHRRHLTPAFLKMTREERRKVIAEALEAEPEKSDRQIGKEVGASKNTVADVREELEGRGQIDHVASRTDTRGREQPATKGKGKGGAKGKGKGKPPPRRQEAKDALGKDLPDNLRDVFADTAIVEAQNHLEELAEKVGADGILSRLRARIKFLPFLLYEKLSEHLLEVETRLELSVEALKAAIPYAICQHCDGKGCRQCRQAGYLPEWRHKEMEREDTAS